MYTVPTVKIVSEPSSDNPLGYIVINKDDFDASKYELFDDGTDQGISDEHVPTLAELLAARDQLVAQKQALEQEKADVDAQAAANAAEAQRLADLAAAASAGTAPDISTLTKDELQAALTAKGISFPAAANKADLIALLTAAA